jgi:ubiquitin carboxyl-terminal hydrolase 36/42
MKGHHNSYKNHSNGYEGSQNGFAKNGMRNGYQHGGVQTPQANKKRVNGEAFAKPDANPNPAKKQRATQGDLFDAAVVSRTLHWQKARKVGPGLFNLGNTCFLNSTLQCLLYTPSLTQILLSEARLSVMPNRDALGGADAQGRTILNLFQRLVADVWSNSSGKPISPRGMVQNIRRVGKQFRPMRQEDAHEYLRLLIDCMHEEILKAHGVKLSDKNSDTTMINRIFGGKLRNELKCPKCGYSSKTFNNFQVSST